VTWTRPAFEALANLVHERTGLVFAPERRAGAESGMSRAMARAGVADPDRYPESVSRNDGQLDDLLVELTVPETYFFREPGQFEFLRRVALPELLRERAPGHPVRAWSAGCSTGEEAYSLAMCFAEEGLAGRSHVLASDLSRAALAKARKGEYGAWSQRGEGADVARRHLRPLGGGAFAVAEPVRRAVVFEHLNLALDAYPSFASGAWGMDLIFCRNVFIYFDRDTVADVALRLFATLSDGGWLFTASTDPPLTGLAPFEAVVSDLGVFYRRPWPAVVAAPPVPPPGAERPAPRPTADAPAVGAVAGPAPTLAAARDDLGRGNYAAAAGRTAGLGGFAEACALHVRALACLDTGDAERACGEAVARHPLSAELHYLHAALLLGLGRDDEAARAARRSLYLDRSLAVAHFLLGSVLRKRGDLDGARLAFRNAGRLCAAAPPGEPVPLSDGEPAGRLAESVRRQLDALGRAEEGPP